MAHLWLQGTDGWDAQRLNGEQFDLPAASNLPTRKPESARKSKERARLIRADAGGSRFWALIAPADSDVRVNGRAVPAGLCVLADRDEIRTGEVKYFFSTETLATVEEFPNAEKAVFCGRCRQQIEVGLPAVRCPGCGVWYHQSDNLPCWTYSEKCTFCDHLTALDAGFAWTPEEA